MKKRLFLIIAFVLLAIGSGATAYAVFSSPDETHLYHDNGLVVVLDELAITDGYQEHEDPQYILVQRDARNSRCTRCNGSGYITGREGQQVSCPGTLLRACTVRTRR